MVKNGKILYHSSTIFYFFIIRNIFIVFRELSEVYFVVCIVKGFWLPVSGLGNLRNLGILTV